MDEGEALEAIEGGANIIDVKNPKEGSLGANFPWVIKKIREITPQNIEISCAIGDVPNLPGTISLAALGAAVTGADYIKTGLLGLRTKEDAIYLMQNVTRTIREHKSSIKVVVAGYADSRRVGSVDPLLIPEIAYEAESDYAMIDTAIKDGRTLFDFLSIGQLRSFVNRTHEYKLKAALAGSLRKDDLPAIHALGADVVGLRGAACTNGDRLNGRITRENVKTLVEIVKRAEKRTGLEI